MSTTTRERIARPSVIMSGSLTGNLTRDFELRFTKAGQAVMNSAIAIQQSARQADGSWADREPTFIDLIVWGPQVVAGQEPITGALIDNVLASAGKGTRVTAEGDLRERKWSTVDQVTGEVRKGKNLEFVVRDLSVSLRYVDAVVSERVPSRMAALDAEAEAQADAELASEEAF